MDTYNFSQTVSPPKAFAFQHAYSGIAQFAPGLTKYSDSDQSTQDNGFYLCSSLVVSDLCRPKEVAAKRFATV